MGCRILGATTWSHLELRGLLEDEESHVHYERAKRHLGLHPFHLTDLNAALREILGSTLYTYDNKLNGIVLSYKNPKLLTPLGTILYDACYIHIDIEGDFYVFRPNVGDTCKGIVNKKSQDHVGILVHKAFNVSVPRPDDDKDWPGYSVKIGQEVKFNVTYLDFKGRLPYIRGSLDSGDYLRGCKPLEDNFELTGVVESKSNRTVFSFNEDEDYSQETNKTQDSSDAEKNISPRKSKKVKREHNENKSNVKRKKKQKLTAEVSLSEDEPNSDISDSEKTISPRKLKKIKREQNEDENNVKSKKKLKLKNELSLLEDESDSFETSESHQNVEVLPPKLKKVKSEINDDNVQIKKKKKKRVKVETQFESGEENEIPIQEANDDDEVFSPLKLKKVKKEKIDDINNEENYKKPKAEVEITCADYDSDLNMNDTNQEIKIESSQEKVKKKHRIKTEKI